MATGYDAVVVGSGPNGLAAAITIARTGRSAIVYEAADTVGGGARSAELTRPGFIHDVCSAIHPLCLASPLFRTLPLEDHGLELVHAKLPFAHPLDGGRAVAQHRSVDATAEGLGRDGRAYARLMKPLVDDCPELTDALLGPLRPLKHPIGLARFGFRGLRSAASLATGRFEDETARALFAGAAAHSMLDLDSIPTAAFGLVLALTGHVYGWPAARGGSQAIADALASYLRSVGGEIETGRTITSVGELPNAGAYLFDVTPRQLEAIAGDRLPGRYRRALTRFRYGPGAFKLDLALSEPVPWSAPECRVAGTVHVGGTLAEIVAAEKEVLAGGHPRRPYVLVAQQSMFDDSRAPDGTHTLWAYCHVPNGSSLDMTDAIEAQIERFAPGFSDVIVERAATGPADLERYNANYVGGDINGGIQNLRQLFTRPTIRINPYTTPDESIYICSSSTPPGGGVHGMCGYWAARAALKRVL